MGGGWEGKGREGSRGWEEDGRGREGRGAGDGRRMGGEGKGGEQGMGGGWEGKGREGSRGWEEDGRGREGRGAGDGRGREGRGAGDGREIHTYMQQCKQNGLHTDSSLLHGRVLWSTSPHKRTHTQSWQHCLQMSLVYFDQHI